MGMGYNKIGDAAVSAFTFLLTACVVMLPLALWKLIEILIYLYNHISISWG